jgi:hypothetical protein
MGGFCVLRRSTPYSVSILPDLIPLIWHTERPDVGLPASLERIWALARRLRNSELYRTYRIVLLARSTTSKKGDWKIGDVFILCVTDLYVVGCSSRENRE